MTDKEKKEIYNAWCNYQAKKGMPIPEYSYQVYRNETYELWIKTMAGK